MIGASAMASEKENNGCPDAIAIKRGPEVYAGGISPWKEPIASP